MYGGRRRFAWRHPLAWLGGAIGIVVLFVLLGKLLLLLAYLSGGLVLLLIAFWLLWRWW